MQSVRARARDTGEAPQRGGKVLRFDRRRADQRGWRLAEMVAQWRRVSLTEMLGRDRGEADVAQARQIAMYLMHVSYGRHYAEVGRFFGRDRTTVSHACALVEELREDTAIDRQLDALELALDDAANVEREQVRAAAR